MVETYDGIFVMRESDSFCGKEQVRMWLNYVDRIFKLFVEESNVRFFARMYVVYPYINIYIYTLYIY